MVGTSPTMTIEWSAQGGGSSMAGDSKTQPVWEVSNQVPPLADYDAFAADPVLPAAMAAFGADWANARLHEAGRCVGSAKVQELARLANRYTPELRSHDRFGN